MNSTASDAELDVWQAAGCAIRIDYSRAVMEELCLAAAEGFNRLAHGGVEIGGVLFGVRDPDAVKILAHRALACEHSLGPSFTLSDNDRCALEDLLAAPHTDSNLSEMQPVGLYLSHTRSEILLAEKDVQLFQLYFPEIWQIALVLRPHGFDPVHAGFFFREPDGSLQAASSRREFIVKPKGGKPGMDLPGDAQCPQPRSMPAPGAASSHRRRRWTLSAAVSAAAIAVAVAGVLFWIGRPRAPADVSLRARDVGGQLRIDWNRDSSVIQQSRSGVLEIEDGSLKVHEELSQEHLRSGSITYLRTTGNVLVRLLVRGPDQSTFTEIRPLLGPLVATATPIDAGSPDRLAKGGLAKEDETDTAPVQREPEREVHPVEPVEPPSNRTPRPVPVKNESARLTPAASAPARRPLVLPPAGAPRPLQPLLPAPPAMAANAVAAIATFVPRLPAPKPLTPADQGPPAGKIIWTGKLPRSGTIQILGNHVSQGHITGGLPGGPVRVQVFPSELTQEGLRIFTADPRSIGAPEAAGAQNGWNRTVYVLNPRKAGEIGILEAPGQQNSWNRLVLRAERGDHSIIVLRWERVPAESALHDAGNR